MFIQRNKELKLLETSYTEPNSTIDFVFGPRNSGKTSLLNEFSKDKDRIYISNYEMIPSLFFTKIANIINNFFKKDDVDFTFSSFLEVLEFLSKQNFENKLIVIMDDFQNIQKVDKKALSDLITFWKKTLKHKNMQLVLSSSLLFNDEYEKDINKLKSNVIQLNYLDFTAIKSMFPKLNKLDQLYVYSLLGTTPTNLKYYNQNKNFTDNIFNLFLAPNSYLFDYGIRVLKSEITDIGTYASILHSISQGNTKIGDIAASLNVKSTYLTRYIQKLIDMMVIKKRVPLREDKKKSKFGRYEIQDNALKFWFSYIYPNLSKLQFSKIEEVSKLIEGEFISKTVFLNYIKCIKEYIYANQKDTFSYEPSFIGSWWDNNGSNIDLIAYNNKSITFVQILWEDKDMAKISYGKLKASSEKFPTTLDKKYIIVTKNTFFNI